MLIGHPARLENNQLPLSFQFDIMKTLIKGRFLTKFKPSLYPILTILLYS